MGDIWGAACFIVLFVGINLILYMIGKSKHDTETQIEELRKFVDSLGEMHGDQQVEIREALRTIQARLNQLNQ